MEFFLRVYVFSFLADGIPQIPLPILFGGFFFISISISHEWHACRTEFLMAAASVHTQTKTKHAETMCRKHYENSDAMVNGPKMTKQGPKILTGDP